MEPRIFEINENVEDFVGLTFVDDELWSMLRIGRVKALAQLPGPLPVELNTDDVFDEPPTMPDYVWLTSGVCCFSVRAWSVLTRDLLVRGETVKLSYDDGKGSREFVLFEPERKFECLDFERSQVKYFPSSGRVSWVDNIVLRNMTSVDEDIFSVEHLSWTVFCTEKCKRLVRANKLTGFCFEPVPVSDN